MKQQYPWLRFFRIIAFDWDGTAVTDRREDTKSLVSLFEKLQEKNIFLVLITGTDLDNIDQQLLSKMRKKKYFFCCTNRGSEVYGFDENSAPVLLWKRTATPEENLLLTESAEEVRAELKKRTGLEIGLILDRLNRRKIDLIPEWHDPPKAAIGELLDAVEKRLKKGLPGGVGEAFQIAERIAREKGLKDPRITSDVKHIEIGLTDKSDSLAWVEQLAAKHRVAADELLVLGDEFGGIGSLPGSDAMMIVPQAKGATFLSFGKEPNGVPSPVILLGGGPPRFREVLAQVLDEVEHLERNEGNWNIDDPFFLIEEGFDLAREHEIQALFTVGNGYVGTLGSLAEGGSLSSPATLFAGIYGQEEEMLLAPDWTHLRAFLAENELVLEEGEILEHRRILDLKQGILRREWLHKDAAGRISHLHFLRLASLADRHLLFQAVWIHPENFGDRLHLESKMERAPEFEALPLLSETSGLALKACPTNRIIAFMVGSQVWGAEPGQIEDEIEVKPGFLSQRWNWKVEMGKRYRLERRVSVFSSRESNDPIEAAEKHRASCASRSMFEILSEHSGAWAKRWNEAGILTGNHDAQQALAFAVYHLVSSVNPEDEKSSIGARGLTGLTYKGHVFWDTEIFMLPFFLHTWPPAARSLLMYRFNTLPAALEKARSKGYRGALFAWESTDDGKEATPPFVIAPDGEILPVSSGEQEHHISADIAYAVWQYWENTGDDDFLLAAGAELLLQTARFWASRGRFGRDGFFHIEKVMGPDEYHVEVDDNAYTNGLAQWNLEKGLEVAEILAARYPEQWKGLIEKISLLPEELSSWREAAARMYTGLDSETGLFEQFRGYFELEDLDPVDYRDCGLPIDVVLGVERIQRSKVNKQADVLMLFFLLWERYPAEVREKNFLFYEPKTAHGSSLSPPVHALLAARLGNLPLFERYFRQTAEIDLSRDFGNAAGGIHMGALGGLWQAVVFGLGGFRASGKGLAFEPRLPEGWKNLSLPLQWRGRHLTARILPQAAEVLLERGESCSVAIDEEKFSLSAGERCRKGELDEG